MVTFPDDYPNSVRHFLLIGFLAMFLGAGVFFYMGAARKVNSTMHTVIFFVCAVTAWYAWNPAVALHPPLALSVPAGCISSCAAADQLPNAARTTQIGRGSVLSTRPMTTPHA